MIAEIVVHSKLIILAAVGGNIKVLQSLPDMPIIILFLTPSSLVTPSLFYYVITPFAISYSVSATVTRLCIVHFIELVTMGGNAVRNEPGSMALLELYPEAYQIFLQAGWVDYFRRLQEFDSQQVLEFARNLKEYYSTIQGVQILVTEDDIVQVSGLPANGIRWFNRKHIILNAQ